MTASLALPTNAIMDRLTTNPVWLQRNVEAEWDRQANDMLCATVYPLLQQIKTELSVVWIDMQVTQAATDAPIIQHVVLPKWVYEQFADLFMQAGYAVCMSDPREFACADGLKEALHSGADLQTKWH